MNVTFVKPPYERLMIKLKPVRAQLLPDLPCSLALHAQRALKSLQGSTFKQREQLINT